MTFTEAALEVLRSAGEPLHYKKITELAIERNLLSHVGKTPEVTMSSRLAMMVKKDRGQAPIIKVKPGVFAIRESALQGQSLSPAALAAISEVEGGLSSDESVAPVDAAAPTGTTVEEAVTSIKAPALPGADMFPEEEGDDDPILAGLEQESEGGERGGRRRRRRRRRGKGGDKADGAEVSVRPEAAPPPSNRERERERGRDSFREASNEVSRERARERHERNDRGGRHERHERHERNDRNEQRSDRTEREERNGEEALDWNRQPADGDLLGKDLADAVWMVLSRGDRVPHSFSRVAELLVRRGRLSGSPAALSPTIAAAIRADVSRAETTRARPRFRVRGGKVSLSEWQLPKALVRAEQDLLSVADRYAAELRRALIQKLSELPTAGFAELLATWLNAEGVTALRAVRRPGSSGSELHFAGTRKIGSEEVRLAIVVQRSGRDIDREAVIDVRGALHHYGQATSAWIVTIGRITSGAREEAAAQAAACALFDGNALAAAMERLGVAMRRHVIPHHEIDYELLESLGDVPEQRERREREQERERRQQSERFQERERHEPKDVRARELPKSTESDELESDAEPIVQRKMRDADWDEDESHDLEIGSRKSIEPVRDREPRDEDAEAEESDDDVLPVTDEESDEEIGAPDDEDEDDEVEAFREELDDSDEDDVESHHDDQDDQETDEDDELENPDASDEDDEIASGEADESEDEAHGDDEEDEEDEEDDDDEREPRTRS